MGASFAKNVLTQCSTLQIIIPLHILSDCHYSDVINSLLNAFRLKKNPLHEIESFEKKWPIIFLPKIECEMNKYDNGNVTHILKHS